METTFEMVAKTFQGLEEVLRDELIALGAQDVETGLRMVAFKGDLELLYKANLCCRTALRVLKPIAKFTANDADELYDYVRDMNWEEFMTPDSTFSVDSTVNSTAFNHSKYVTYRVKDGIADHFSDSCGRRPSVRLNGADLQFNVHIQENRVTISLDSSGEPLSKRGYRVEQTEAPINEVLAAGIIMKTGWHGECDFADPMCGSGTFLIEAALIAGNINPGIYREHFAFEKWPDFDSELFESIYNDDSAERDITCEILGGDIDPDAVGIARRNVKAARLDGNISIVCQPMQDWDENERDGGILVTNPPYGERLRPADMEGLYRQIGETLKFHFQGWHAWILGYKDEHFSAIGLKPSVKFPILNGSLECSLREYVLFSGKYNEFRSEGGSVHNADFNRTARPKTHHKSDAEWEDETRSYRQPERKSEHKPRHGGDDFERRNNKAFRTDDRRSDRKSDFKSDRKSDFKSDRKSDFKSDRKSDFKRRDDRPADRKSDFKSDRKSDFKRRDDRPDRKSDFKSDRKSDFKRRDDRSDDRQPRQIFDRGPRLGEEHITFSSPVHMRTRKPWKKRDEETDE